MPSPGSVREVFTTFLGLGLTSFGGPVAHLAYYRAALVERRRWLDEAAYADLVALAQFLPGPTSSQVGVLIGWQRAGWGGALAAWTAFTLPSALLLGGAALVAAQVGPGPWLTGLLAAVVAVVGLAVTGMARSLCPDLPRGLIALAVAVALILVPHPLTPLLAMMGAGLAGWFLTPCPMAPPGTLEGVPSRRASMALLGLLVTVVGVVCLPIDHPWMTLARTCVTAGGLVMGGGHVVLPLLRDPLVDAGLLSDGTFLAGYGAAQAVPGPLFAVAAWLGAAIGGPGAAAMATVAIFAPGVLLALGTVRFYRGLMDRPHLARVVRGLNAGVVGLLAAAWWDPIVREGLTSPLAVGIANGAALALASGRIPAWAVVLGAASAGAWWA